MSKKTKQKLLVTTSTYPRWENDTSPAFVADFVKAISKSFSQVKVIAPHAHRAKHRENAAKTVHVRRYRYALPASAQTIAYDGGAHNKISKNPVYLAKLALLIISQFMHVMYYAIFKGYRTVNAHWVIPQGFLAVLTKLIFLGKLRVIVTVHGSDVLKLDGELLRKVKRFTFKHANEVVVNSSVTLSKCREIYERDYHLIPMGIDIASYGAGNASRIRKKYDLGDTRTLLFVGRFSKEKGIRYLCEAVLKLSEHTDLKFKAILVGDGPEKKTVDSFIHNNRLEGVVHTPGWVSPLEIKDYYAACDVLVGPSTREALGLVFLEALASGTPIVATSVGGIKDVLVDGVNGLVVKSKSSEDIYDKLLYLLGNKGELEKLKRGAKSSVIDDYSWESVARRYSKIMS